MQLDDYAAAAPARRRLTPKRRFISLPDLRFAGKGELSSNRDDGNRRDGHDRLNDHILSRLTVLQPDDTNGFENIELNGDTLARLPQDGKNEYRWAALFENQRGYVRPAFKLASDFYVGTVSCCSQQHFTHLPVSSQRILYPLHSQILPLTGRTSLLSRSILTHFRTETGSGCPTRG